MKVSLPAESCVTASSKAQHEFTAFIASRAYRSDARKQGDDDRSKRYQLALVVSLLVHGLLYLGVRQWSLLHRDNTAESTVIQLRLIDPPAIAAQSEVIRQPSPESRFITEDRQNPAIARSPIPPMVVQSERLPSAQSVPAPIADAIPAADQEGSAAATIFDRQGRVILPAAATDDPAVFGSRKPMTGIVANPMTHQSPLSYQPTRFDRDWKPDGETLLGEWVRKLSKETSHDTKYGTRISCKAFLFLMACGWGPTPRVSIEELKAMRANPPAPRTSADDPYLPPIP